MGFPRVVLAITASILVFFFWLQPMPQEAFATEEEPDQISVDEIEVAGSPNYVPPPASERELEPVPQEEVEPVDPSRDLAPLPQGVGPNAAVEDLAEKPGLRTEDARFFTDPGGGVHTAQVFMDEIHYESPSGTMKPIETDVVESAAGYTNEANYFETTYPGQLTGQEPVIISLPEGSIRLFLEGTEDSPAVAGRSSVLYKDVFPDTDVEYVNTPSGYAERLVLGSSQAPAKFTYRLETTGQMSLVNQDDGTIAIMAGDQVAGMMPPDFAQEIGEGSDGQTLSPLPRTLSSTGANEYMLQVDVPDSWLEAPDRDFPVVVDPIVELEECGRNDLQPNHCEYYSTPATDTYVQSAPASEASSIHSGRSYLKVGKNDSGHHHRSFLRFVTGGAIAELGDYVERADFYIYNYDSQFGAGNKKTVELRRLTNHFEPSTLTWNNQTQQTSVQAQVWDSVLGCGANWATCNAWHHFNLEGLYESLVDNDVYADWGYRLSSPSTEEGSIKLYRSQNDNQNQRPYLLLQLNARPDVPDLLGPEPNAIVNEAPSLQIDDVTDQNQDKVYVRYQVATDESFNTIVEDSDWIREKHSYQLASNKYDDGKEYFWRVKSWDGLETDGRPDPPWQVRKFTLRKKLRGHDDRFATWSETLGNGMTVSVNQANGNFLLDYPLDSLALPGNSLDLGLTYNSQTVKGATADSDTKDLKGPAKGWEISAGPGTKPSEMPIRIEPQGVAGPDGNYYAVTIIYKSGREVTYVQIDGNVYGAIGPQAGTLRHVDKTSDPHGGWTLTTYTGGRYTFTENGDLDEARPSTTTGLTKGLKYVLTDDEPRRIKKVYDQTNPTREVTFGWSQTDKTLTKVTAFGNREWLFHYTPEKRLQTIEDPDGNTVEFGYEDGLLSSIYDGQARLEKASGSTVPTLDTEIDYSTDLQDRVLVQSVTLPGPDANRWRFNYGSFFNEKSSIAMTTTLLDPRSEDSGAEPSDYETITDFNKAGFPIQISEPPLLTEGVEDSRQVPESVRPLTLLAWSPTGQLLCRRDPLANAADPIPTGGTGSVLDKESRCASVDGETEATVYDYQDSAPYLLEQVDEPTPLADTSEDRLTTIYKYDEGFQGLRADYFGNIRLEGVPGAEEIDIPNVDYGTGGPSGLGQSDNFGVRWTGQLQVDHAGVEDARDYEFRVCVDAASPSECQKYGSLAERGIGSRVIVGGDLGVNCWLPPAELDVFNKGCGSAGSAIKLDRRDGGWQDITVEFKGGSGAAEIRLEWKKPDSTSFSPVPEGALRPHIGALTSVEVGRSNGPAGGPVAQRFSLTSYVYGDDDKKLRHLATTENFNGPNTTNQWTTYQYKDQAGNPDQFGRVSKETNASGESIIHEYAPLSSPVCEEKTTDREAVETTRVCDARGDVTDVRVTVDENVRHTHYEYTPLGRERLVLHDDGGETRSEYDDAGRLTKESVLVDLGDDPESEADDEIRVWDYDYSPEGWLTEEHLPDPDLSDSDPRPSRVFDYDGVGNEISSIDANGHETTHDFSGSNLRMMRHVDGISGNWRWTHDASGNVLARTSPNDVRLLKEFDLLGRVLSTQNAGSEDDALSKAHFTYDARGNVLTSKDPTGVLVTKKYDASNRVYEVIERVGLRPQGQTSRNELSREFAYDAEGNLAWESTFRRGSNGNQIKTHFEYDAMGRLEKVTAPHSAPNETFYDYNEAGELLEIRTPRGGTLNPLIQKYVYDQMGRRHKEIDGNNNETVYDYNLAGELVGVSDPRGLALAYSYDRLGRKILREARSGNSLVSEEKFDYDNESNLILASNASRTIDVSYDPAGRPDVVRSCPLPLGVSCQGHEATASITDYTYDNIQLSKRTDPAGETLYFYDPHGRTSSIVDPLSGKHTCFTYDDADRVLTRIDPTRLLHSFSYDPDTKWQMKEEVWDLNDPAPAGDVCALGGDAQADRLVARFTSSYDPDSNVVSRHREIEGSTDNGEWILEYDEASRLDQAVFDADTASTNETFDYTYDPGGNRLKEVHTKDVAGNQVATTTAYSYDTASRPSEAVVTEKIGSAPPGNTSAMTFEHDETGNMTEMKESPQSGVAVGTSYRYDPWNRLVRSAPVVDVLGNDLGPLGYTYEHDALDRTVETGHTLEVDGAPSLTTTEYEYAGTDEHELARTEALGGLAVTKKYAHALGEPLAEHCASAVVALCSAVTPVRFFGVDPHGDVNYVNAYADSEPVRGTTLGSQTFDPWGEPRSSVAMDDVELGFQSDITHKGLPGSKDDMVDMGARNYSPALGRFSTVDPVEGEPGAPLRTNPYIYGLANPITNSDPTGLYVPDMSQDGKDKGCLYCVDEDGNPTNHIVYSDEGTGTPVSGTQSGTPTSDECFTAQSGDYLCADPVEWDEVMEPIRARYYPRMDDWLATGCQYTGGPDHFRFCTAHMHGSLASRGWYELTGRPNPIPYDMGDMVEMAAMFVPVGRGVALAGKAGRWMAAKAIARFGDDATRAASKLRTTLRACTANSFTPRTLVLMADGTTKKIKDVEVGDLVWAKDPAIGKSGPRRVSDTIVGNGRKQLVEIEIDGASITATDRHPFWVDDQDRWVDAEDLKTGDTLMAVNGEFAIVESTRTRTVTKRVHNLTVAGIHTYFVFIGDEAVLVHNCAKGPNLRLLHPESSLSRSSLEYWKSQSTDDIVRSLGAAADEPLLVKSTGLIMDGNTRIHILMQRGFDVNSLPRVIYGG